MKITETGLYKTADNQLVKITDIRGGGIWPVKGYITTEPFDGFENLSWTITGCASSAVDNSLSDPALYPDPINLVTKISYDENPELFL